MASCYGFIKPNTHRRCDETVELSRVEVFTRRAVCIEFATNSRRLPTDLVENLGNWTMLRIYPAELSCVGGVYALRTRWLSRPSLQFCGHRLRLQNCKLGHDCRRVRSDRRHDATRLRCRQICSDSSRLSPTQSTPPTRLNSTVRRVGGVYWV